MTKPRKSSIPIQFEQYQIENMDSILEFEKYKSYAELVRKALDFYISAEYPQLLAVG